MTPQRTFDAMWDSISLVSGTIFSVGHTGKKLAEPEPCTLWNFTTGGFGTSAVPVITQDFGAAGRTFGLTVRVLFVLSGIFFASELFQWVTFSISQSGQYE